jgi:cell division protein FtsB
VTVAAITGDRGYLDVRRQRNRLDHLRDEVKAMRMENAALLAEVRALRKDPYVIEKIAREKLGYARPGEVIFQFPPERPPVEDVPPPQPAEP